MDNQPTDTNLTTRTEATSAYHVMAPASTEQPKLDLAAVLAALQPNVAAVMAASAVKASPVQQTLPNNTQAAPDQAGQPTKTENQEEQHEDDPYSPPVGAVSLVAQVPPATLPPSVVDSGPSTASNFFDSAQIKQQPAAQLSIKEESAAQSHDQNNASSPFSQPQQGYQPYRSFGNNFNQDGPVNVHSQTAPGTVISHTHAKRGGILDPNRPAPGKLYVGALKFDTTETGLTNYFSQFGKVLEAVVMSDPKTGRSRGFGFVTFEDPASIDIVLKIDHNIDGRKVDPRRAVPKEQPLHVQGTPRCFVANLTPETTESDLRDAFKNFGQVSDVTVMRSRNSGESRGFGFVTFSDNASLDNALKAADAHEIIIHGKPIDMRVATPKGGKNDSAKGQQGQSQQQSNHGSHGSGRHRNRQSDQRSGRSGQQIDHGNNRGYGGSNQQGYGGNYGSTHQGYGSAAPMQNQGYGNAMPYAAPLAGGVAGRNMMMPQTANFNALTGAFGGALGGLGAPGGAPASTLDYNALQAQLAYAAAAAAAATPGSMYGGASNAAQGVYNPYALAAAAAAAYGGGAGGSAGAPGVGAPRPNVAAPAGLGGIAGIGGSTGLGSSLLSDLASRSQGGDSSRNNANNSGSNRYRPY